MAAVDHDPSSTVPPAPPLPGTVDEYIGSRLRRAFDAVAEQPIPDRFVQLMAALDER